MVTCYQQYCKCLCNGHLLVEAIEKCGLCTADWCVQQNPNLCGEGEETVLISCFQVESLKEKLVVCMFLVAVVGLLVRSFIS